ncbi:hypothetical protein DFQ27_000430 [Actinomortierella ambigua]|uniref:Uncharacterized protein n=1 Tax=Actinomortierella ambigua TaxID=1343610 RepID=A0A9P6QNV7_9FUNG|nr:hypothetical protein DFQ27_000430 [Actinomortierella ambigua]
MEHTEDVVLRAAFENAASLSLDEVAHICDDKGPQEKSPVSKRQRPCQGTSVKCNISSRNSSSSGNSGRANGGSSVSGSTDSGNGSSGSSSLTVKAAGRMHEEYKKNFDAFNGEEWQLASGTIVDNVICTHALSLVKESSLHSFVIERVEDLARLFEDDDDKEAVRKGLARRITGDSSMEAEELFLKQYLSTPDKTNTALAQGWSSKSFDACELDESSRKRLYCAMLSIYTAYEEVNFRLPTMQTEAWFLTTLWAFLPSLMKAGGVLDHQPGEIVSDATSLRKNSIRTLQSRKVHGRKIDGILTCATTRYEFGAIEAAKTDDGPQGTKALCDSRKLAKVLKDMHDRIVANASSDVRCDLVTYGLQIARSRITFYSLHKRLGRHYQLVHDGTFAFPPTWDKSGRAATPLVELLIRLLRLKKEMEAMADNIVGWTMDTKTGFEREVLVCTLTTPLSSPKHERS